MNIWVGEVLVVGGGGGLEGRGAQHLIIYQITRTK